eukprot:GCRY01004085.1.p1 GENE.GCRY01004085.1~~GCRY01004085.1.p1  ORF type:complete len:471 (+),score=91.27 GCRY01004085.1:239-1651(+)
MEFNFSELFEYGGVKTCVWSPNSRYIATTINHKLLVRDGKNLQLVRVHRCEDEIQGISWSPDSEKILCTIPTKDVVQVFSLADEEYRCTIDEGCVGVAAAYWAPDSLHVLTLSQFSVRFSVWALTANECRIIRNPKGTDNSGFSFSADGKWLAVLEREEFRDFVNIMDTDDWGLAVRFQVCSQDAQAIEFSPLENVFALRDSSLQYLSAVYSLDGTLLSQFVAYHNALGLRTQGWSPSGQLLALGSFDNCVRVLNNLTYTEIAKLPHLQTIKEKNVTVYREIVSDEAVPPNGPADENGCRTGATSKSDAADAEGPHYEIVGHPAHVAHLQPNADLVPPKAGVRVAAWSHDAKYLCTLTDNAPSTLYIWKTETLSLFSVVIQSHNIRAVTWSPCSNELCICTGEPVIFMWFPDGVYNVSIPSDGPVNAVGAAWSPDGQVLAVLARRKMTFCFPKPVYTPEAPTSLSPSGHI